MHMPPLDLDLFVRWRGVPRCEFLHIYIHMQGTPTVMTDDQYAGGNKCCRETILL